LDASKTHRLIPGPSTQWHTGMFGETLGVLLDMVSQFPRAAFWRSWKVLEGLEVPETVKV